MYIYEYDKNLPFNLKVEKEDEKYVLLSFDTVYEPDIPESSRVYVYRYSAENPWMRLIFLHGIGNGHIPYLMWFAENFAQKGIETYFLIQPYHMQRTKQEWNGGEPFFHHSPAHCIVRFHQAIKDVRRTIDLLESGLIQGVSNDLPLGIMGFSFGGMIATMSLALDSRLDIGVLAFTGGDWRWINWYSPYVEPVREGYKKFSNEWGCKDEPKCIELRSSSRRKVHSLKELKDIFTLTPTCFHYDPLSYAKFVKQPVLMFSGVFDKVIPKQASNGLYRLLPNATKITVPSGHKSSYLFRRFIAGKSLKFFKKQAQRIYKKANQNAV